MSLAFKIAIVCAAAAFLLLGAGKTVGFFAPFWVSYRWKGQLFALGILTLFGVLIVAAVVAAVVGVVQL